MKLQILSGNKIDDIFSLFSHPPNELFSIFHSFYCSILHTKQYKPSKEGGLKDAVCMQVWPYSSLAEAIIQAFGRLADIYILT